MDVISSLPAMHAWSRALRRNGRTVGFVPTMGALHAGHASLVQRSRETTDATVLSIFVNPTQFGPAEDYAKYPRPFEADCDMARNAGCDAVFAPPAVQMYPKPYRTWVEVEALSGTLCGASRPGHFRGVATVVLKLFNIVAPDIAFFGQKDAQQVIVLKRMAADLNVPVTIEVCPTVREADGLAMSSRNAYLTAAERAVAHLISQGLADAAALHAKGERRAARLAQAAEARLRETPLLAREYCDIVDTLGLQPLEEITGTALMACACRTAQSRTRLIDNIVLGGTL